MFNVKLYGFFFWSFTFVFLVSFIMFIFWNGVWNLDIRGMCIHHVHHLYQFGKRFPHVSLVLHHINLIFIVVIVYFLIVLQLLVKHAFMCHHSEEFLSTTCFPFLSLQPWLYELKNIVSTLILLAKRIIGALFLNPTLLIDFRVVGLELGMCNKMVC